MKKLSVFLLATLLLLTIFTYTALATDNGADDLYDAPSAETISEAPDDAAVVTTTFNGDAEPSPAVPGEPLTWAYLATIAGAAAATLLVVQYAKVKLDNVWKIPTRVFVYIVALAFMLLGTAFTTGLTVNTALLTAVNAIVAAVTAYGAYEVTFSKKDTAKT